jgi:hypothetical protein
VVFFHARAAAEGVRLAVARRVAHAMRAAQERGGEARPVAPLVNATGSLCRLQALYLPFCGLNDVAASVLLDSVATNDSLQELDLSDNSLGRLAAAAAARAIPANSTLVSLSLSFNSLGWGGTICILRALAENSSLIELHLENTILDPRDAARPAARAAAERVALAAVTVKREEAATAARAASRGKGKGGGRGRGRGVSRPQRKPPGSGRAGGKATGSSSGGVGVTTTADDEEGDFAAGVPPMPRGDAAQQLLFELASSVVAARVSYAVVALEYPERSRVTHVAPSGTDASQGIWTGFRSQASLAPRTWSLARSVWRMRVAESDGHSYYDTKALLGRAFEADWTHTKINRAVKNEVQRALMKPVLKKRFPLIREAFRYYCCSGGGR